MTDIIVWPRKLLVPRSLQFNLRPFSRSGGRSLGGIERVIQTDIGYWQARLSCQIASLSDHAKQRTWNAIRTKAQGRSGLIAVPAYEYATAPYPSSGPVEATSTFSDDATFDDGSVFVQRTIIATLASAASIGDTSVSITLSIGEIDLSGVRFSYEHAMYETGPYTSISGSTWTLPISPAIRADLAAGIELEFDNPTCLMHMASDDGMDYERRAGNEAMTPTVDFVEAVDYWNDLAA